MSVSVRVPLLAARLPTASASTELTTERDMVAYRRRSCRGTEGEEDAPTACAHRDYRDDICSVTARDEAGRYHTPTPRSSLAAYLTHRISVQTVANICDVCFRVDECSVVPICNPTFYTRPVFILHLSEQKSTFTISRIESICQRSICCTQYALNASLQPECRATPVTSLEAFHRKKIQRSAAFVLTPRMRQNLPRYMQPAPNVSHDTIHAFTPTYPVSTTAVGSVFTPPHRHARTHACVAHTERSKRHTREPKIFYTRPDLRPPQKP